MRGNAERKHAIKNQVFLLSALRGERSKVVSTENSFGEFLVDTLGMSLALLCCSKFHDSTDSTGDNLRFHTLTTKTAFLFTFRLRERKRNYPSKNCLPKAIKSEDVNPITKPELMDFESIALHTFALI
jgi:hypothetical protein